MTLSVSRRWNHKEFRNNFDILFAIQNYLCIWLGGELRAVDDPFATEPFGVAVSLGHIVPVSQENVTNASHRFDGLDQFG